ncbi:Large terminase protein [Stylophora pistillata]|uniref:Large terminase protein n=1 Tax=Stylophora pistillata TaxID=50429 RepID=A0A2B4R5X8_STYPI|nr:Large terminase protein [Stylophora pistillata]
MESSALEYAELLQSCATRYYQERFLYYAPHDKQQKFHAAGKTAKERLFLAGNRTGKTFCGVMEVAMHLTGHYPDWWTGHRYELPIEAWAAGVTNAETYQVLEKAYIGDVSTPGAIAPHLILGQDRLKHLYKIQHISGGVSQLRFKSYEQGRKTFQGAKIQVVHLDEEPPRDIYVEALMRTMSTQEDHHGMMLLTMTPLSGLTDMVLHFQETVEEGKQSPQLVDEGVVHKGKCYIQASWSDNPHLKEEEKASILQSLKPHEREAREKGIPALGMGMVYPVAEHTITCEPKPLPDHWPLVYGIDFGWNPSPTAVLFAAYDRDNDILYFYDEYTATERTPEQHVYHLLQKNSQFKNMRGVFDPAGKISAQKDGESLVQLYRKQGIYNLLAADNSKEKGIQEALQRMQTGRLKIFKTLHQTLKELRMYARDDLGIPKKRNDHLMDAMRYVTLSGIQFAQSPAERARQLQHIPERNDGDGFNAPTSLYRMKTRHKRHQFFFNKFKKDRSAKNACDQDTGDTIMATIGYARVSSKDQSIDLQLEALKHCDEIFKEKVSGIDDKRPQLQACLQYVRKGDTLVVTKLDRLARSTPHLCRIADTLHQKGCSFKVLDQDIDTSTSTGRLLFNMLGAIAQFETEIRSERQMDGIRRAQNKGVKFGRKARLSKEECSQLISKRRSGTLIKDLMKDYNLSKASVYQYLKRSGSLCVGAREEPSDIFDFNSVFSFSPSFDEEPTEISSTDQEKIVRDCQSIVKEPLGNALMQSIYELLEENRKEKSADSPQKVLFFPNESTCFDASKRRKNKVGVHIGIKNTEDSEVMQITEGAECGDTEKAPQSFQQILQHELIHVYHFLKDQKSYLKNVKVSQEFMFLRDVNTFWPSLHNVEDSLKNLTLWNNTEEFLTVLGKEVEPEEEKVEEEKENFFLAAKEEEKAMEGDNDDILPFKFNYDSPGFSQSLSFNQRETPYEGWFKNFGDRDFVGSDDYPSAHMAARFDQNVGECNVSGRCYIDGGGWVDIDNQEKKLRIKGHLSGGAEIAAQKEFKTLSVQPITGLPITPYVKGAAATEHRVDAKASIYRETEETYQGEQLINSETKWECDLSTKKKTQNQAEVEVGVNVGVPVVGVKVPVKITKKVKREYLCCAFLSWHVSAMESSDPYEGQKDLWNCRVAPSSDKYCWIDSKAPPIGPDGVLTITKGPTIKNPRYEDESSQKSEFDWCKEAEEDEGGLTDVQEISIGCNDSAEAATEWAEVYCEGNKDLIRKFRNVAYDLTRCEAEGWHGDAKKLRKKRDKLLKEANSYRQKKWGTKGAHLTQKGFYELYIDKHYKSYKEVDEAWGGIQYGRYPQFLNTDKEIDAYEQVLREKAAILKKAEALQKRKKDATKTFKQLKILEATVRASSPPASIRIQDKHLKKFTAAWNTNLGKPVPGKKYYEFSRNIKGEPAYLDKRTGLTYPVTLRKNSDTYLPQDKCSQEERLKRLQLGQAALKTFDEQKIELCEALLREGNDLRNAPMKRVLIEGKKHKCIGETFGIALNKLGPKGLRNLASNAEKSDNPELAELLKETSGWVQNYKQITRQAEEVQKTGFMSISPRLKGAVIEKGMEAFLEESGLGAGISNAWDFLEEKAPGTAEVLQTVLTGVALPIEGAQSVARKTLRGVGVPPEIAQDLVDSATFAIPAAGGVKVVTKLKKTKGIPKAALAENQTAFKTTKHGVKRKIEREVKSKDELDALKNPLRVKPVRYLRRNKGRPFYKFKTPFAKGNKLYRKGDSFSEFFNVSDRTFRRHLKPVTTIYESKSAYLEAEDKFKGMPILCYFDRKRNVPVWDFNPEYEEQFGEDFFKNLWSSEALADSQLSDRLSDRLSDTPLYRDTTLHLLPQSPHLNSNQPELVKPEEEEISLKEKKEGVASTILPVGEKETGKKANKRSNANKTCSACGDTKTSKKRADKKKRPKSLATEHQQNTVKRLQKIHQEVTGIPMAENLRDETVIMSFETFMRDFQGDFRKYHAYCRVMESSDFLMRRDSSSKFKAFFAWAMRRWNVAKVKKGDMYQLKLFYDDLVEALLNAVEAVQQRIMALRFQQKKGPSGFEF